MTERPRKFVTAMELMPGHLGRVAFPTPPSPGPPREPTIERAELHGEMGFLEVADPPSPATLPQGPGAIPSVFTVVKRRLNVHRLDWTSRKGGEQHNRCFFAWDPERQVLLLDPRPRNPPKWLRAGLWRRLMAVDAGLLERWDDEPLRGPGRPEAFQPPGKRRVDAVAEAARKLQRQVAEDQDAKAVQAIAEAVAATGASFGEVTRAMADLGRAMGKVPGGPKG